jgi:hypothetical protein
MKFSVSCLILLHVTTAFALTLVEISVPSVIQAETPTNASLDVEIHAYQETTYAYALRVYLASSMYGKIEPGFYHSDCQYYLVPPTHSTHSSRLPDTRTITVRPNSRIREERRLHNLQ